MPPRATGSRATPAAAQSRVKGSARASANKPVSYLEDDDAIQDDDSQGAVQDEDQDEDASGDDEAVNVELAKVIRIFSKSGTKKQTEGLAKLEKQCDATFLASRTKLDGLLESELGKCNDAIAAVGLDIDALSGLPSSDQFKRLLAEEAEKDKNSAKTLRSLFDEQQPTTEDIEVARKALRHRFKKSKKTQKKLAKEANEVLADQTQMAELYAQSEPTIFKHFKGLVRA